MDSSAWIEFLRATGSAVDRALTGALRDGAPMAVTGVIVQEVLAGSRGDAHAAELLRLMAPCRPLQPVYPQTFEHAAALYRRCRASGSSVRGTVDCLIAALALEHGMPVLAVDRDMNTLHRICAVPLVRPAR